MSCLNEIDSLTFDTEMTIKERVKIPGNTGSEKDRDSISIYKCTIGRIRFSTGAIIIIMGENLANPTAKL